MQIIPDVIKEKLQNDEAAFNIRMRFPNGERTDICNDMIVEGSAKFTESLCSQNEIKLGLCESPVFECETVNVGNIKGAKFVLTYEILCGSDVLGAVWKTDIQKYVFEIQKGIFVVQSCERQADMQHRKIVAYGGGASNKWSLPDYETKTVTSNLVKHQYDLFKSLLTKFDLKDLPRISADVTTDVFNAYNKSFHHPVADFDTVVINANYMRFIFPLNDENIYYANYENITTFDSICEKIIKGAEEQWGEIAFNNEEKEELFRLRDFFKLGNVFSNNPNPFLENSTSKKKYLTEDALFVNKEQYFNKYNTNSAYSYQLFVPYSLSIEYKRNGLIRYEQEEKLFEQENFSIMKIDETFGSYKIRDNIENIEQMNLQEIFSAGIELMGKSARFNSDGSISFADLKRQFYLKPSTNLKPNENLKPLGVVGSSIGKSQYSSLWYEEAYSQEYKAIYCSFKNANDETKEMIMFVDSYSGEKNYKTYDISNNAIVQYNKYTNSEMTRILQNIADSIKGVSYVPLKLKCVSIPFVECGDTLEVLTQNNDSITTIVMKRTLSGESYVTDEITSV